MKSQKTKLIKPQKNRKKNINLELIGAIIMFITGLILITNSSKAVIIICYCIGILISLFGGFNLLNYYRLKKELKIENTTNLIIGVITVFIGIITIILASAIETFLRFIIGLILILNGLSKIKISIDNQNYIIMTIGIVLVGIGLYTVLAENIVFIIVGSLLILSSIIDIIKYFKNQKK